MRRCFLLSLAFTIVCSRDSLDTVLARIHEPTFRDAKYFVKDFGARGDGKHDDLPAFAAAIRQAHLDQGGTVITEAHATYLLQGPLELLSNVHVHLRANTTLQFSADISRYLPAVLTRFEGTFLFNFSPLVRAFEVTSVAITGEGPTSVLDGAGKSWFGKSGDDTNILRAMGNDSVPVYKRVFGEGHKLPPNFVEPFGASNVLLENFQITNSPFWTVHPVDSTNVIVRNLTIETTSTKNSDGIDPDGSTDVLIEGNWLHTGDDAIAIKSGRDTDAWRHGRPTENVVARHNTIKTNYNAICIGSEMSGGVSNVYAYDNHIIEAKGEAMYFKSNLDRGAWIRDVDVWNTQADTVGNCIQFTNNYHGARGGHFPSLFRDFNLHDNVCTTVSRSAVSAVGLEDMPLQNVNITNLVVHTAKASANINIENVINWRLRNVSIAGKVINKDYNVTQ